MGSDADRNVIVIVGFADLSGASGETTAGEVNGKFVIASTMNRTLDTNSQSIANTVVHELQHALDYVCTKQMTEENARNAEGVNSQKTGRLSCPQ